jgi:hypothetical protein
LDLRGRKCWEAGEDCIMRSFVTKYYYGDKIQEGGMSGACSTHGREKYKLLVEKS